MKRIRFVYINTQHYVHIQYRTWYGVWKFIGKKYFTKADALAVAKEFFKVSKDQQLQIKQYETIKIYNI